MLGRRHFRIKVLQSLYAYFQGGEERIDVAEKNLLRSIDRVTELYFTQLSLLLEVIHFYKFRMEEAKGKFFPTEEELNPNLKLLENRVIIQLQQNLELAAKINRYKISWTEEQEMVRKIQQKLKSGKDLQEYLSSGVSSFQEDQEFAGKLFRKYIVRSGDFESYCEERDIHWADDYEVAAQFVLKTFKLMPENFSEGDSLVGLLTRDSDADADDDRKFLTDLFRKTIRHSEEFEKLIDARTKNWELERIALTDIIILKMAMTEFVCFSQIPVKVSMNEYIEISKSFSSVKSKSFINGILDKLAGDLTEKKKIKKTGRGLMT